MAVNKQQDAQVSFMTNVVQNLDKPIAAVVGFAVGKFAIKKLEKNQAVGGLSGDTDLKKYLIPAAVTVGGAYLTYKCQKSPKWRKHAFWGIGAIGVAGAGVEALIKKSTGKSLMAGIEGLLGEEDAIEPDYTVLSPAVQELPAADIDIEEAIQQSVSGASDFSMSDEPVAGASDFSMSDEPVGGAKSNHQPIETEQDNELTEETDPFAGDMLED